MNEERHVLSIGQCSYDHGAISQVLKERFGVAVHRADSGQDAHERLASRDYELVLINRKLDRDGSSGLDVLSELRAKYPSTPMMLVSNFDDAQQQAVKLGAKHGFGKAELTTPATIALLKDVLSPADAS